MITFKSDGKTPVIVISANNLQELFKHQWFDFVTSLGYELLIDDSKIYFERLGVRYYLGECEVSRVTKEWFYNDKSS
jgi:hypothetical protein